MLKLTFQRPPDPLWLQGFAVGLAVMCGALTGGLAVLLGVSYWPVVGLVPLVGILVVAYARPVVFELPYRGWNRLARLYSRVAEIVVLSVCYYTILAVAGWTGSRLPVGKDDGGGSGWESKRTLPLRAYPSQSRAPGPRPGGNGWIRSVAGWSLRSGNVWVILTLPFLILIRCLESEDRSGEITSIYTVF